MRDYQNIRKKNMDKFLSDYYRGTNIVVSVVNLYLHVLPWVAIKLQGTIFDRTWETVMER